MMRAYKYKMEPTDAQKELLSKCFGCARFVYMPPMKRQC